SISRTQQSPYGQLPAFATLKTALSGRILIRRVACLQLADSYIAEPHRARAVLQRDRPGAELRILDVDHVAAVQRHLQAIADGADLKAIPLPAGVDELRRCG